MVTVAGPEVEPLIQRLRTLGVTLVPGEPLRRHTSFKIGGPALLYLEPVAEEMLLRALPPVFGAGLPVLVMGLGSNLLVADAGFPGVVIEPQLALRTIVRDGNTLVMGAGLPLAKAANEAARQGLAGLEFAISIPGTIGGATVMNAGAHGSSMADVVTAVRMWSPARGAEWVDAKVMEYRYRFSRAQLEPWVILAARLALTPSTEQDVRERMRQHMDYRKATQPVGEKNAGSMFKNPDGYKSGALIEAVGGKGIHIGGARVSELHANFFINLGPATAHDVLSLMRQVRQMVFQKFQVVLRPEVRWVGPPDGEEGTTWDNLWLREGEGLPARSG